MNLFYLSECLLTQKMLNFDNLNILRCFIIKKILVRIHFQNIFQLKRPIQI